MTEQLSDATIISYINEIKKLERMVNDYKSYISIVLTKINSIKNFIRNNCNHTPTIDYSSINEHTEYHCSRCLSSL